MWLSYRRWCDTIRRRRELEHVIRGIGPVYARRLVKMFGKDVFDIIEATPERLREVEGIGPKRAAKITAGSPYAVSVTASTPSVDDPRVLSTETISAYRW